MSCKDCKKQKYRFALITYIKALGRRFFYTSDVPFEVELKRKLICFSCDHFSELNAKCKCPVRQKTIWASEECPNKLWPKHK